MERFVQLLSGAVARNGMVPKVVDLSDFVSETSSLRRMRYLVGWRIGRLINRNAAPGDVIVCSNFISWNARRSRSIVVYHGTDKGRSIMNRQNMSLVRRLAVGTIGSFLEKRTGKGRVVVAVSNTVKEEIEQYYGLPVREVIPNAVSLDLFSPAKDRTRLREKLGLPIDKFLILFVGTPERRKGLPWILESIVPHLREDQRLVVRSDIDNRSGKVIVVGRLPLEQLAELYSACDALLFPTSYEGCSYSLIEALASGLPVITSPAGSGRDLLDDAALKPFIIDGTDTTRYLEAINRLSTSKEGWTKVSHAARAFAEKHHGMPDFEGKYLKLIRELAANDAWTK